MELYVREDRRIVEIWLTGAEKQDAVGRLVRRRRESSVFWLPDGSCKARAGMVQCCCGEGCGQSSHAQEEYTVAEAFAIAGYVRISVDDEKNQKKHID